MQGKLLHLRRILLAQEASIVEGYFALLATEQASIREALAGALTVTAREVRLLREQAQSLIDSYELPGEREDRQPYQWHEGRELMALADRLSRTVAIRDGAPDD